MIKTTDTAYPITDDKNGWYETGLTKREYFAAMAMQGILASHTNTKEHFGSMAKIAVLAADALIAELNK